MLKLKRHKRAQSVLEYLALFAFLLSAFIVFQKYIWQGMAGRWKSVGDTIGQGRLYEKGAGRANVNGTMDCAFDFRYTNTWYDADCFHEECWGNCYAIYADSTQCSACILGCTGEAALWCM